jgi:uncharacterized protein (DUF488 family)
VDVRRWPLSRRHPHFNREVLRVAVPASGIRYRELGDGLGGFRSQGYAAHTATPQFGQALEALMEYCRADVTAFMCAERSPERCHRLLIARELEKRGLDVRHLLEPGEFWAPVQGSLFVRG